MNPLDGRRPSPLPPVPSQATLNGEADESLSLPISQPDGNDLSNGVYSLNLQPSWIHADHTQNEFDATADHRASMYGYSKHQSILMEPDSGGVKRRKTYRYIPLTPNGNLVIDVPVADDLLNFSKNKRSEFTHTRYTAVTCSADDFANKGYVLRQQENKTTTEIFIVVTMYNEDHELFCKTMWALMKNIKYLCSLKNSEVWGPEGWKKVVVCIVSDGRSKINRKVLDVLGLMGVYQDGIMKEHVNDDPVTAHLFEYTTEIFVSTGKEFKVRGRESGSVPMQVLFCLKEKNAKKVSPSC